MTEFVRMEAPVEEVRRHHRAHPLHYTFEQTWEEGSSGLGKEIKPLLKSGFPERLWNQQVIKQLVLSPGLLRVALTVRLAEKAVGFASIHDVGHEGWCQLHWVAVAKRHRGKGLAGAMTVELATTARALGYSRMVLYTEPEREQAIRLYERLGFEIQTP